MIRRSCRQIMLRSALQSVVDMAPQVAAYGTDASKLQVLAPCVIMGPGDIAKAHSPDECVSVAELEAAVPLFMRLAKEIWNGIRKKRCPGFLRIMPQHKAPALMPDSIKLDHGLAACQRGKTFIHRPVAGRNRQARNGHEPRAIDRLLCGRPSSNAKRTRCCRN